MKPISAAISQPKVENVQEASSEAQVRRCWPAFNQLRPALNEEEFVARWKIQSAEGYRIAYIESDGVVVGAAGYRTMHTLAWGRMLYLDDLIALASHRGQGIGAVLLAWLKKKAIELGCDEIHLDTGYQRHAAHKAYLQAGFQFNCHHLALTLE